MPNVNLGRVRYNPARGAFEARVDIDRNGVTYRYPCSVTAPLSADPDQISRALTRRALRMSDTGADLFAQI